MCKNIVEPDRPQMMMIIIMMMMMIIIIIILIIIIFINCKLIVTRWQ